MVTVKIQFVCGLVGLLNWTKIATRTYFGDELD